MWKNPEAEHFTYKISEDVKKKWSNVDLLKAGHKHFLLILA